jgi:hypothetical protein
MQMNMKRVENDWVEIAQEPIKVEQIGGAIYAFCSEIAALRLFHKYRGTDESKIHANYSENLKTWFFRLDIRH